MQSCVQDFQLLSPVQGQTYSFSHSKQGLSSDISIKYQQIGNTYSQYNLSLTKKYNNLEVSLKSNDYALGLDISKYIQHKYLKYFQLQGQLSKKLNPKNLSISGKIWQNPQITLKSNFRPKQMMIKAVFNNNNYKFSGMYKNNYYLMGEYYKNLTKCYARIMIHNNKQNIKFSSGFMWNKNNYKLVGTVQKQRGQAYQSTILLGYETLYGNFYGRLTQNNFNIVYELKCKNINMCGQLSLTQKKLLGYKIKLFAD